MKYSHVWHPNAGCQISFIGYTLKLFAYDINEICSNGLDLNTIQELSCKWKQNLDSNAVKSYVINYFYPLLHLFGEESIPDVHKLLTSFYQLDDEARAELVEMVRIKWNTTKLT